LARYQPQRYGGRVVLFRTRGHPFWCSFDPLFGWGRLAGGGIELVRLPGAHEGIFMEPHVRDLSARFLAHLQAAQQIHHPSRSLPHEAA
jgi:aspartate racemase